MTDKSNFVLNLSEAASILGVSTATVMNWVRQEHISPLSSNRLQFSNADLDQLRDAIDSGSIKKLNKRANKAKSNRTFVPQEYLENLTARNQIKRIITFIQKSKIHINEAMFYLSINLLVREGIIPKISYQNIHDQKKAFSGKRQVHKELIAWRNTFVTYSIDRDKGHYLLCAPLPFHSDLLGLIYQSILAEGSKASRGSYYTPPQVVDAISGQYAFKGARVLDPCCGSGQFLLSFAKYCNVPNDLYGFDTDKIAVRIARINLLIKFRELDFEPNIFCQNFILSLNDGDLFLGKDLRFRNFDVVATNPPWGLHYTREEIMQLDDKYPDIKSHESFSYFIKTSIDLLKEGGVLSFILPESILNVKIHADIRRYITKNTLIDKIIYLNRVFKNVFTPVIRLDLKQGQNQDHQVGIEQDRNKYFIRQARWAANEGNIFDIQNDHVDAQILDKIYGLPHTTLKGKAKWALGIVTGDNKKHLFSRPVEGAEAILKGADIKKYCCLPAKSYVKFEPSAFQQVAPIEYYRASQKLVYRFISKQLVFAFDDRRRLTLNSANILIPEIQDYPIKAILALFNSSLYQFIFQKKFASIKVLRGHIEQLPLPLWGTSALGELSKISEGIIVGELSLNEADQFIFGQFNLNDKEIQHIEKNVKAL